MGSSSNAPKSSAKHHPLTYSISAAQIAAPSGRNSANREHRRLDRSVSEPVAQPIQQQPKPAASVSHSSRYKTELCRPFEENGLCKYGDKCQFAHGMNDLRNLARHPKYKTELCRTFHSSGICPYGPRCHFIHNDFNRNPLGGLHQSGNILQQPGGIVLQQPGGFVLQQPRSIGLQRAGNNLLQQSGNILQQPLAMFPQSGNRLQQSGNIPIPTSTVDPFPEVRGVPVVDILFKKNFSPGSTGDLSPNSSSLSGSPTSCNGFLEADDSLFSPVQPLTAPPILSKKSFFGPDITSFSAPTCHEEKVMFQRLSAYSQSSMMLSVDNLEVALGDLAIGSRRSIPSTASQPEVTLQDDNSKLRLPIFNKLAYPKNRKDNEKKTH